MTNEPAWNTAQQKYEEIDFINQLDGVLGEVSKFYNSLSGEEQKVIGRFYNVFFLFAERIEGADISNTPIATFEAANGFFESIRLRLERLHSLSLSEEDRKTNLVLLDNLADSFLYLFPSICTSESNFTE